MWRGLRGVFPGVQARRLSQGGGPSAPKFLGTFYKRPGRLKDILLESIIIYSHSLTVSSVFVSDGLHLA